jgi:hypothetical protein
LSVVGKTAAEVASRADVLAELAFKQLWQRDFVSLAAEFRRPTSRIMAECYFAMSEAYKRQTLSPGARSEWTKVAALTAATIAVVNPIRPSARAADLGNPAWLYVNPSFAMFAAYDGIPNLFFAKDFDEQRRVLRSLRELRLPSLNPIIVEGVQADGNFTSDWYIDLNSSELSYLDLLISYFVLLKENEEIRLRAGRSQGAV